MVLEGEEQSQISCLVLVAETVGDEEQAGRVDVVQNQERLH